MVDRVDSGPPFVVALHDVPRCGVHVGVHEHVVLGAGVVLPPRDRLQVHRRQFPPAHGVFQPGLETCLLLLVADAEPVLAQHDAVLMQHPLEDGGLVQEPPVLLGGAESHHAFDAPAVVPTAVEQDDLAGGRQLGHVALEVPLRLLALRGRRQRRDPRDARVQVLGDPFDGPALAGGVAALEDHDQALAVLAHPLLHLDQFRLQAEQFPLVELLVHPGPLPGVRPLGGVGRCGLLRLLAHERRGYRASRPSSAESTRSPTTPGRPDTMGP